MIDVNLQGANLQGANLSSATLIYVNLQDANLQDVNLSSATLIDVNLKGADLRGADFHGADLEDANLQDANLQGAKNYYCFSACSKSKRAVHCVKWDTCWMVQDGRFWGSLDDLEEKVKTSHNSAVYIANIELLRTL